MEEFLIGMSAGPQADAELMRQAGVRWVRQGFPFPFADRVGGQMTETYLKAKEAVRRWRAEGFRVMGISPLPGFGGGGAWRSRAPAWMGEIPSDEFFEAYRATCAFLASDLADDVSLWQICNELYSRVFAGPLSLPRACELVFEAAAGLKEGNPSCLVGTNMGGINQAYYMLGRLYGDARREMLDYCGVDQYFGTWRGGGPETWDGLIEEWSEITGSRLLINEWGYASEGGLLTEEERRQSWNPGDFYVCCRFHKFGHAWGAGHTPEVQAEYIRETFKVFHRRRDKLLGCFFYRWEDQEKCWCGRSDCPGETRWGIVDLSGRPKPGYYAFQEAVAQYFG